MNREQRRELTKALFAKGLNQKEVDIFLAMRGFDAAKNKFNGGEKVVLNIEKIKSDVNWNDKTDVYKNFVKDNEEKHFTVELDQKYKDGSLVCLLEDSSSPKWLWWCEDLKIVED